LKIIFIFLKNMIIKIIKCFLPLTLWLILTQKLHKVFIRIGLLKNERLCAVFPFGTGLNKYLEQMNRAMANIGIKADNHHIIEKTEYIWYNWIEIEYDDPKVINSVKSIAKAGKKIIWACHDRLPHETNEIEKSKEFMKMMANLSRKIVVHSNQTVDVIRELSGNNTQNLNKIVYVTHPNYIDVYGNELRDHELNNDKLVLCYFGLIKKYKNIELLISAIKELDYKDIELKVFGQCVIDGYTDELKHLIGENRNILAEFRFIDDIEIPKIIANSHLFILPYNLNSSLNSGATIMSFSYGRSVISPLTGTLDDIEDKTMFYSYTYKTETEHYEKLKTQIMSIHDEYKGRYNDLLIKGKQCQDYVRKNNSIEVVSKQIAKVFEG